MSEQTQKYVLMLIGEDEISAKTLKHVELELTEAALQRVISQMDELPEWCAWLNEKARQDAEGQGDTV